MKEIKFYPETMDKREKFSLMSSDRSQKMMDLEGAAIDPESWILYLQENQDGEEVEVLTIRAENAIYSTISPTFIKKFKQMVEYMGDDLGEIIICSGTSKAGRKYLTCDLNW